MNKIREQMFLTALIAVLCAFGAGANRTYYQTWLEKNKAAMEKRERLGEFEKGWDVFAKPFEVTKGMTLTPEKASVILNSAGYVNLSNKNGVCPAESLKQPKTYCQSFDFFYVTPSRSEVFPPLKLQFDRKGKTLKQIFVSDGSRTLDNTVLEPTLIFELDPVWAVEKVKKNGDDRDADDAAFQNKEVFKQTQPTHKPLQIGRDIEKDDLFFLLLLWSEDRSFFEHNGVAYRGVARAIYQNLFGRDDQPTQGSSTLTAQTCKQIFSRGKHRSIFTKIDEFFCAAALEDYLTTTSQSKEAAKLKILELYANLVPLSIEKPNLDSSRGIIREQVVGFRTASLLHLGKELKNLNPAEKAALVTSVPAPNRITKQRFLSEIRDELLKNFAEANPQHADRVRASIGQPVTFKYLADGDLKTDDAMTQLIKKKLREQKVFAEDNENKVITVIATIDWQMQAVLANALEAQLKKFKGVIGKAVGGQTPIEAQADFLILDSTNGEILNYLSLKTSGNETMPNLQSLEDPLKPGSSIKPLFVVLMIDGGLWTMNTTVTPSECKAKDGWQPDSASGYTNADTVQNWLLRSNNPFMTCACRTLTPETGIEKLGQFFGRDDETQAKFASQRRAEGEHQCRTFWGVSSDSVASIFDLAAAYSTFPSGIRKEPTAFKQIYLDGERQELPAPQQEQVFSPEAGSIVAETLQAIPQRKFKTQFKGALFAKTGSTTYSYVFVTVSPKAVFLAHLKIVPRNDKFNKKKVETIFAGDTAVPLMEEALKKVAQNRPHWIEGNFKNSNVRRLRVSANCVTSDETSEVHLYMPGTEPPACSLSNKPSN